MLRNPKFTEYWQFHLHCLAQSLERELAAWEPLDSASGRAEEEQRRRGNTLWRHASQAGAALFKVCGEGAFDERPRIKNHIFQVRSELLQCIKKFEVPPFYFVSSPPYSPPTNDDSYDVFFVKIFEGLCRLWPVPYEDQRILDRGTDLLERANVYVRLINSVSESLEPKPRNDNV